MSNKIWIFVILLLFSAKVMSQDHFKGYSEELIISKIPSDLPEKVILPITLTDQQMTLQLTKHRVYGKNTRFLVSGENGDLVEIDKIEECTYRGIVPEHPGYQVIASITDKGLTASIIRPNQEPLEIKPSGTKKSLHQIHTIKSGQEDSFTCGSHGDNHHAKGTSPHSLLNEEKSKPERSIQHSTATKQLKSINSTATLPPNMVMDVLEFEVGVEIGSRSFFSTTAYNGDLATAQAAAQSLITNLDTRYLNSAGIKYRLGTVIIRTDINTDPLRNTVVSTGASPNALSSLNAFRNYWNSNPSEVGTTHDLAVYHVASAPSGLAIFNSIATTHRYTTTGGNSATSWADGTSAHEVGHQWNLKHTGDSGLFYEARPRNNAGSTTAGGNDYFISIMHGGGNHNIARLSTNEARVVMSTREAKRSAGDLVTNPGQLPPFGVYDEYLINSNETQATLDVIINDYDMNNDILDVQLLDAVSFHGGTISLSQGTGPGGRNELLYTAPPTANSTRDFFHYTVMDTQGGTDFGAVYVKQTGPNTEQYLFDLGTETSPVRSSYIKVSDETQAFDYGWTDTNGLNSTDRGGTNTLNRDLVYSNQAKTFEAKVMDGIWEVVVTFGDAVAMHDEMQVKAEGEVKLSNVTSRANEFFNRVFLVNVFDGKLTLEFSDQGGTDQNWAITRIILNKKDATTIIATPCDDFDPCTPTSIVDENLDCIPAVNLALNGTASASSTLDTNRPISNIIDGSDNIGHTSNNSPNEWMEIDLGMQRQIDFVRILNRTSFQSRLNNSYVLVADTPFPSNTDLNASLANADFSYQLGNVANQASIAITVRQTGRYVRLQKSGNNDGGDFLNIRELEIFSTDLRNSCDDGNACTTNDQLDVNCNCRGTYTFNDISGSAIDIGSGGSKTYSIDANNHVLRWNECTASWSLMSTTPSAARIDVDGDGMPWIIATDQTIHRWNGSTFIQMPGTGMDIGINGDVVYTIGLDKKIYKWSGSAWIILPYNHGDMIRVDVTNDGRARTIGEDGLHYWDQGNGVFVKGTMRSLDVSVPEDSFDAYVLAIDGTVHLYIGAGKYELIGATDGTNLTIGTAGDTWVTTPNRISRNDNCVAKPKETIGSPCDDGNLCTTNDVYVDNNCTCEGVLSDADSDGVCDTDDVCPGGDDTIDSDGDGTPDACDTCDASLNGTTCDDNDACTTGDTFDASCNCVGTFADADNDGVCDVDDICAAGDDTVDTDGDGTPDACDSCDANLVGTSCNDNNNCTVGDVYDANCNCAGTFADADNDGVCDADDICAGGDDTRDTDGDGTPDACDSCDANLVGTSCNDNNNCTVGDVYDANCNCAGTFADADNDGVCDADDICAGGDDTVDTDGDGTPDFCDSACTTFSSENFETNNSTFWTPGGRDSSIRQYSRSPGGSFSAQIRDNSAQQSSITSSVIDLSSMNELTVSFEFQAYDMEQDEDFFFEISTDGGVTYSIIQEWNAGTEFVNEIIYQENVVVNNQPFSATTVLRFRCDASSNVDEIYLDNIVVSACETDCIDRIIETNNDQVNQSRSAIISIESNQVIPANSNIEFNAGDYILLQAGFEVTPTAVFHAYIEACQ